MPVKLRTPKVRNDLIPPEHFAEACALFKRGLELQRRGADDLGDDYEEKTDDQKEYAAVWRRLTWGLLGLPGSPGPLDVFPGCEPSGSEYYRSLYPHALALRRLLQKGIRR